MTQKNTLKKHYFASPSDITHRDGEPKPQSLGRVSSSLASISLHGHLAVVSDVYISAVEGDLHSWLMTGVNASF